MKLRPAVFAAAKLHGRVFLCLVLLACAAAVPAQADDTAIAKFLAAHWQDPPVANVAAASQWGPLERSLLPQNCGACHAPQLAAWQGSRHAKAMSAGLLVQILGDEQGMDSCNMCHAPLLEQRKGAGNAYPNPLYDEGLREAGLMCASCHVRDGHVYGPIPRTQTATAPGTLPHGGFRPDAAFSDSQFCAHCHQFAEGAGVIAGLPLENTYNEWAASPQAAAGQSCQSCHMPDRQHLWRGIHDPEMTASGLTADLQRIGERRVRFSVTSTNVGHKFPTYITPRVTLVIEGRNAAGKVVADNQTVIQRRIDVYLTAQEFDTRLDPGATASVELDWWFWTDIAEITAYVRVEPDEFYNRFFKVYTPASATLQPLLRQARKETETSAYNILTQTLRQP